MIYAQKKRKENIAEYILYLWQLEDLMRAYRFDIQKIEKDIVSRFSADAQTLAQIGQWYASLVDSMKQEKIEQSGHLLSLQGLMEDLETLNGRLLADPKHSIYQELYAAAAPAITELTAKSGNSEMRPISACLQGLYGLLMLKLKSAQLSEETSLSFAQIGKVIAYLSQYFHKEEAVMGI